MYTESQLNGLNKGQVVNVALKLAEQLDALSKGPVTADRIKSEFLNLKKQSIDIAERRELAKQQHEETLKAIIADKEKQIKELELKFSSEEGLDAKQLDKLYTELEKKATKAQSDLTFGLEKAENDAKVELDKISIKVEKAKETYAELKEDLEGKTKNLEESYVEQIEEIQTKHTRDLEQISYDQKIALRDKDNKFIESVAKDLKVTLINSEELKELKDFKATDEKEVSKVVEEAVTAAKAAIHASEGSKLSALKNSSDNTIALLENDKKHLESQLKAQEARILDLEARLKEVPTQIKEAVAAAKAEVVTNVDTGKK